MRDTVHHTFDAIVRRVGLRKDAPSGSRRRPSPCIHDFRHTLAVRTLEACPAARATVGQFMLALSTFLGHGSIAGTFWYLHSTPELMTNIADACATLERGGAR